MNKKIDSIENNNLTSFQTIIKNITSLNKILLQLFVVIGVILTLIYCSLLNFYPSGLTIGDSLFFIATSLAFVSFYTIICFLLFCAGISISPLISNIQSFVVKLKIKTTKDKNIRKIKFPSLFFNEITPYAFIGYFTLFYIVHDAIDHPERAIKSIIMVFFMGVAWGIINSEFKPSINTKLNTSSLLNIKVILIIMTYIMPIVFIGGEIPLLDGPMRTIGVRVDSTTIQLAKKQTQFLKINNIIPFTTTKLGEGIFKNTTILFQGIGTNIYIEIENFRLTVPSKDIIIGKFGAKKSLLPNE